MIAALAIAAPGTMASAATPHAVPAAAVASRPAVNPAQGHRVAVRAADVIGPTLIGDVFNGGVAIVTSPSASSGTVTGDP
jgi:hypothetical protein